MIDFKKVKEEAKKQIVEQRTKEAVNMLKSKYSELDAAKQVVSNIEREIEDLEISIQEGTAF